MKKPIVVFVLFVGLWVTGAQAQVTLNPVGTYDVVAVTNEGEEKRALLVINLEDGKLTGTLTPEGEEMTFHLEDIKVEGSTLSFNMPVMFIKLTFEGDEGNGNWTGSGSRTGTIRAKKRTA